jgi:signal peptidase I
MEKELDINTVEPVESTPQGQEKSPKKKSKLKRVLKSILEWFLILIFAIVFAVALRVFLLASFLIPTGSMSPTIIPGDFIFVNKMIPGPRIFKSWDFLRNGDFSMKRLKGYRKIRRNEVIVFNYPYSNWNKLELDFNVFYAKRCIAIPGDTFYINNGIYRIKNVLDTLGYYPGQEQLSKMKPEEFPPHIYNCYPDTVYKWNILNFGPLYIPGENDTVAIDSMNIRLYRKLIEYETQQSVEVKNGQVFVADKPVTEYVFQQNYYFMAGDYVRDSRDSRYWGLLPEDHIVGKAFIIWKSKNRETGKWQWKRFFKTL